MAKPKLTPWFPASVHPVRPGIYQRRSRKDSVWHAVYRDGKWFACTMMGQATAVRYAAKGLAAFGCEQTLPWRGLASDPRAAK